MGRSKLASNDRAPRSFLFLLIRPAFVLFFFPICKTAGALSCDLIVWYLYIDIDTLHASC